MPPRVARDHWSLSRREFFLTPARVAVGAALLRHVRGAATPPAARRGQLLAYVGTFASGSRFAEPYNASPGNGRGIHVFTVDATTGDWIPHQVVVDETSPNCLALNSARTHLFATHRGTGSSDSGTVTSYAISPVDGRLTLINRASSGGAGPTHLSVHPAGQHLLVANYIAGTVAVVPIRPDGRLGAPTHVESGQGKLGPLQPTSAPAGSFAVSGHDSPHAHMIEADASGRFVLATDLARDRITRWRFDLASGRLLEPQHTLFPPGDGPRHFAFHPNGRWLASLQEEGSTLTLFAYDPEQGRLEPRQTLSTLPPGFQGTSFTSEVLFSADGHFVYAANRLHDSIAIYAFEPTGRLTYLGEEWTRGDYPRSFSLAPAGTLLAVCNQRSDHICTFRVDPGTGRLTATGKYIAVGSPSVVQFLETTG